MRQEEYILGAAMLNENACLDLVETIKNPDAFTNNMRKGFFKAIKALFESGKRPDIINTPTEAQKFLKKPENDLMSFAISLTNQVSGTSNTKELAEYVQDQYLKRRLGTLSAYLQGLDKNPKTYQELMAEHLLKLDEIENENDGEKAKGLKDQVEEAKEQVKLQIVSGGVVGTKTGLKELDEKTGGLQDGHLITIAGRPGMGKSVLAMNIAYYVAQGSRALFFSREMTSSELIKRIVCSTSDFTMAELFTYRPESNRLEAFNAAANQIGLSGLVIDEESYRLSDIVYRIRKEARQGLRLAVIDYLQLLEGQVQGNDTANLTKITRTLKQLAKELNIPIIILSQLNREVEHRPNKVPMLSDLKQTGSIEEDSNIVIFCYRPEYYGLDFQDETPSGGLADLIVAKNRNGKTGAVRVRFEGNKASFLNFMEEPIPIDYSESDRPF